MGIGGNRTHTATQREDSQRTQPAHEAKIHPTKTLAKPAPRQASFPPRKPALRVDGKPINPVSETEVVRLCDVYDVISFPMIYYPAACSTDSPDD